jgi:DNA-binding Lrp family transcriptional regulator
MTTRQLPLRPAAARRVSVGRPEQLTQASLDQRIVAALQVSGRATWREIARLAGTSESTVARRGRALMAAGVIRTTALADPMRCGFGYPVLVQLTCAPNRSAEVGATLQDRPDVRMLALVTGRFDIVAELIVSSSRHLARILLEDLPRVPGILSTTTESVVRNFKLAYDWSAGLLGPGVELPEDPLDVSEPVKPVALDRVDLGIIDELREDGRRSYPELAAALGISESASRRRVEALIANRCLRPVTLVDPGFLGFDVEVLVWLQVELGRLEHVAGALIRRPEVRYASATSGYSDLVAEVILRSQDDLYRFQTETLGSLRAIRSAEVALELRALKRAYLSIDWPATESW